MLEAFRHTIASAPSKDLESSAKRLLDTLPFVAFVASPSGATIHVNQHYQAYTGLSAEALTGDGWAPLVHPEDRDQVLATWMSALIVEAAYEVECRLRRADGTHRWFKARALPHRVMSGPIEYWLGICTDVHDLKMAEARAHQAEAAAREAEEWLRLAQEASGVGTFDWDPLTIELRWSAECKALFGFPADAEITDDLFLSRVHPDDRTAVVDAIDQTFDPAGSGHYQIDYRVLWPDGTLRWVEARGRATFAEVAGLPRAVKFIGTAFDTTHAKRTEEALAQRSQELEDIADAAPALIWVAARDGPVHHVNDQWCRYSGQTSAQALGDGWFSVLHPDDAGAVAAAWRKTRATGASYEVECRYRRWDGMYRRQLVRAEPMRDVVGAVTAWVGTSVDIEGYVRATADPLDRG
jgi:PAS domain S-box-containing protein